MSKINKKSELLIPGGSYNRIKTAFLYGGVPAYTTSAP